MTLLDEKQVYQAAQDCVRCGTCRVIYADRIKSQRFGLQCPPATGADTLLAQAATA